jgi:hypothetical protein
VIAGAVPSMQPGESGRGAFLLALWRAAESFVPELRAVQPPGARFCPECGRAVATAPIPDSYTPAHIREQILAVRSAIEGERKQVSVLFCDIVRSSALAAELGP